MSITQIAAQHLSEDVKKLQKLEDRIQEHRLTLQKLELTIHDLEKEKSLKQHRIEAIEQFARVADKSLTIADKSIDTAPASTRKRRRKTVKSDSPLWQILVSKLPTNPNKGLTRKKLLSLAQEIDLNVSGHTIYKRFIEWANNGVVARKTINSRDHWYRPENNIIDLSVANK